MKRLVFTALFVFFLSSPSFGASFDPSLSWQTLKTDHFEIHFAKGMEGLASLSAKYLEEAYDNLTAKFGWEPSGRTHIILTDNNDIANAATSTLPYNWMTLRTSAPDPDNVLSYYDNWLRTLIYHEYTHILHIDRYGGVLTLPRLVIGKMISPNGTVPGWMREGIATYIETTETGGGRGQASYSEMLLRTAILEDSFPTIDMADGLMWKWPSYQTMYIFGVKFLQYLADTYGEDKLLEFQKRMSQTLLFFDVDHQARNLFVEPEYISRKQHNHYARIRKPGSGAGTTFPVMWNEWIAKLAEKYKKEKDEIETKGLTKFENVADGETKLSSPAVSPDNKYLAYARFRVKGPHELRLIDLATGEDKVIRKRQEATRISFSPDSKKIVYSSIGVWKKYNVFSDLYLYDIESGKVERLTRGQRASDPSFSPDGKNIIFVQQKLGASWLAVYDMETGKVRNFSKEPPVVYERFAHPSWSPDGRTIATSLWKYGDFANQQSHEVGQWDIYLYDVATGGMVTRLTSDKAVDSRPVWGPDGRDIYFASDRSGISNIYKMDSRFCGNDVRFTIHDSQLTNVLTGAFQPAISPDGKTLYVQYYKSTGFDIRKTVVDRHPCESRDPVNAGDSRPGLRRAGWSLPSVKTGGRNDGFELSPPDLHPKKYSPFSKSLFIPRFTVPAFAFQDNAVFLSVFTGTSDPLKWHNWVGGVNYRTDIDSFLGYYFTYRYNRHKPVFSAGINEYPVNFGNVTFIHSDGTTNTVYLYEGRRRMSGGATYPWGKQTFNLNYFWENRRSLSNLTASETDALNLRNFAGFSMTYNYGQIEKYPASISPERGRKLKTNFTITDNILGSTGKNEQRIFTGDYREYIDMPWSNHVLALRTSGGMTWGDTLIQGTFSLGGDLGEGIMGGGGESLYYFPLRGLPVAALSRTRALLFSSEYRIPLAAPQRGLSTRPYFLKNIHMAPFLDYGNAWNENEDTWGNGRYFFNNFFLGAGVELRGDFVLGHGLPVTGRMGYGIIVVNRDRIKTVTAPFLWKSTKAKNGVLILQLGTAF